MARNYVVFSSTPDETYLSPNPPDVAIAERGEREVWLNASLKHLTIDMAGIPAVSAALRRSTYSMAVTVHTDVV
jgi:hypothetical protein